MEWEIETLQKEVGITSDTDRWNELNSPDGPLHRAERARKVYQLAATISMQINLGVSPSQYHSIVG